MMKFHISALHFVEKARQTEAKQRQLCQGCTIYLAQILLNVINESLLCVGTKPAQLWTVWIVSATRIRSATIFPDQSIHATNPYPAT